MCVWTRRTPLRADSAAITAAGNGCKSVFSASTPATGSFAQTTLVHFHRPGLSVNAGLNKPNKYMILSLSLTL